MTNRVFHKLDEIGNNTNISIRGFTKWKQKKSSNKMLCPVNIEPCNSDFKSNNFLSKLI